MTSPANHAQRVSKSPSLGISRSVNSLDSGCGFFRDAELTKFFRDAMFSVFAVKMDIEDTPGVRGDADFSIEELPPRTTAAIRFRMPVLLPDFGLPFAAAQSSVVMSDLERAIRQTLLVVQTIRSCNTFRWALLCSGFNLPRDFDSISPSCYLLNPWDVEKQETGTEIPTFCFFVKRVKYI